MGLMDMFNVRDIRSIATGYLGARVDAMQESARVKAEQKKFQDELAATTAANIEQNIAIDNNRAKIDEENKKKDEQKRLETLLAMGYTEDYVRTYMPNALLNDNILTQMDLANQARWGDNPNWKTIKLTRGPEWAIGMTPMEYELELFKTSQNKSNVKNNVIENNNVSDNIAEVTLGNNQNTDTEPYNWSTYELLNGKKNALTKVKGQYINPQGQSITAFETETSPGSNTFGQAYATMDVNGEPQHVLLSDLINFGFVERFSQTGEDYYFKNNPTVDSTESNKSFMLTSPNGKKYAVYGYTENYKGGLSPVTYITSFEPELAKQFNIKNGMIATEVPFGAAGKQFDMVPFNPTLDDLRTSGFQIDEYDAEAIVSSRAEPEGKDYTKPLDVNRFEQRGIELVFGKENVGFNQTGLDVNNQPIYSFSITGEDPNLSRGITGYRFTFSDLDNKVRSAGQNNVLLNDDVVSVLGLSSNVPNNLDGTEMANAVANKFIILKEYKKQQFLNELDSGVDFSALKRIAGIGDTVTDNATIAEGLANYEIGSIRSAEGLVTALLTMEKEQQQAVKTAEINLEDAIDTYIIPPIPGEDYTFEQFIVENIKGIDIDDEEAVVNALAEAILPLTGEDTDAFGVLINESRNIINKIKQGDSSIKKEDLEDTMTFSMQEWLDSNRVETREEAGGLAAWNKKYGYVEKGSLSLFKTFDYVSKTGLKKFVNPDLPPGHVEPRPTQGAFRINDWDRIWSETHNEDGTPK